MSFKKGENRFVDKEGKWTAPYVPAFIRKYPFVLGKSEKEGNYVVCIDRNAPHFSEEQNGQIA